MVIDRKCWLIKVEEIHSHSIEPSIHSVQHLFAMQFCFFKKKKDSEADERGTYVSNNY